MALPSVFGNSWSQAQNSWRLIKPVVEGVVDKFPLSLSDLSEEVIQQFLQLAIPGNWKVNFNVTTINDNGADNSVVQTINHGLPKTPKVVVACCANGAFQINVNADAYAPTTFRALAYRTDGPSISSVPVAWIAIGEA